MCEITIPSSPGWYLSNILASNDDGSVLAYGAKHEVVILKATSTATGVEVHPSFIPLAHKDRIVALAFAPGNSDVFADHLVSCSDDGSVHVFSWQTETLMMSHAGHGDSHKVVCVDWSRCDTNLIVSVSDQASVVAWDLQSNTIRRLFLGHKVSPIVLSCCPHKKDIVAVGCKSGLVLIYSIKNDGNIVFRCRGHETDVVSLSWCPKPNNIFKESDDAVHFLASGAKDRTIYLWRAGSDGRYECFLNLPQQPIAVTGYRTKTGVGGAGSNWICVRWIDEHVLLASSLFGELVAFDLKKADKDGKLKFKPPRLLHGVHNKGLFSIAAPFYPPTPQNRIVWTYALDKHLVATKFDTGKIMTDITTIGGIVYCLAASPLDPNRIAIGTGDNKILVWNSANDSCDNVSTFWNKINSKVMALAWHPMQESLLAFGTGEGRIGMIDVAKSSNPPRLFRQYHRRSVYSLIWSPPVVEISDRKIPFALFSVGDGDILQHNPDTPEKEPINLSSYFKQCDASAMVSKSLGRTDLAWNHDRSLASVGNDNGVLYVVDGRTFNHVHTIFAHKKLVQCTVWHPATVTSEDSMSPFSTWLASASDNIQIINVTQAGVDVVASLNTHSEKVVSLAWSPHFNGRLISASYDYTSQVWDVASGSVLACFDGHHSAVVCCLPSALHQDWVITGSADNTVRVWNLNNYRLTKTKTKKQRLTGALKKFAGAREATELQTNFVEQYEPKPLVNGEPHVAKHVEFNLNTEHKRKPKSMFPVTSTGLTQAKHISLLWSQISGSESHKSKSTASSGYLDFFGDVQSMRRLAVVEETYHREQNNLHQADNLSLWSGDIAEAIQEARKKKQLNDWLVSIAPMVSHKLWADCCRCYAMQLAATGDTMKAVSYLLSVHLVEEAIELLLEAKLFREAVCLAKLRLPRSDPTVKKAMTQWANHCLTTGTLTLAAHCMLSIGANIEAVEILAKTKDPELLALAADIAIKAEANEMGLSLAMRAINTALENQNYPLAKKTCANHPDLEDLSLWVEICELKNAWVPKEDPKTILNWINGKVADNEKWLGLYEEAFGSCKKKVTSYSVLLKFLPNKPTPESEQKVWAYIAGQISLAAAAQLQINNTKCVLKHLILAMEAGYNFHLHNPSNHQFFLQLCVWISPWGPLGTLPQMNYTEITLIESFCSFLACGVVYWLDLLHGKDELPADLTELNSTVKNCAKLLFHKDIMGYHRVDVEIKRLESSIAQAKLKALKAMKYCKDIEAHLTGDDADKKPQANADEKPQADTDKKPEADADSEADSKKLARLKTQKTVFEDERIYTPNPFITFCTLRNVLQSLVQKNPETQATLDALKLQWDVNSVEENGH